MQNSTNAPVLNNLNPQMFTSQIPLPSGLKRRNSTTNSGLTDMINKSIAKNNGVQKKKKYRTTVAGADTQGDRKLSYQVSQRHSMLPYSSNNNSTNGAGTSNAITSQNILNRDPRPLRDRNFQNAMQQEIFDYMVKHKFDIEVNHPISIKSLKQPTQKGFVFIFKWLYLRLDPGYTFTKSIEQEVYQILRTLQYPYLETINKSQISAVGGNSWHKFLGMLHWLVRTNIKLDVSLNKMDQSLLNQNTQDVTVLNYPLKTQDEQDQKQDKYEVMIEQLCINYVTECYKSYLKAEEDFTPMKEQLKEEFQKFVHIFEFDINNLHLQNEKLTIQCDELARNYEGLKLSREKYHALKSDLNKFQNYVEVMDNKSKEWPQKLERMKSESTSKSNEIKDLETEINDIRTVLRNKRISIGIIEEKNQKRESITKSVDSVSEDIDQFVSSIKTSKVELEGIFKALVDTLRQYDLSLDTLVDERMKLGHSINKEQLKFSLPTELSTNGEEAITYEKLFKNKFTIGGTVKDNISSLNGEIQERIKLVQEGNSHLETELMSLKQEVMEKTKLMEKVELQLSDANSVYELNKQESDGRLLKQEIEIEKIERKINESNKIMRDKLSQTEQSIQSTKLKREELQLDIDRQRSILNKKVIEIIEYSSNFKIGIQNKIESTENLIADELNKF